MSEVAAKSVVRSPWTLAEDEALHAEMNGARSMQRVARRIGRSRSSAYARWDRIRRLTLDELRSWHARMAESVVRPARPGEVFDDVPTLDTRLAVRLQSEELRPLSAAEEATCDRQIAEAQQALRRRALAKQQALYQSSSVREEAGDDDE